MSHGFLELAEMEMGRIDETQTPIEALYIENDQGAHKVARQQPGPTKSELVKDIDFGE